MKLMNIVAVAALALSASTAFAQTGNGSDVTGASVSATVGGVFNPGLDMVKNGTVATVGGTVTVAASTPVSIGNPGAGLSPAAQTAHATVNSVIGGSSAAVATYSATLTTAGLPGPVVTAIVSALQSLNQGGTITAGNVANAVSSWNTTISNMTPAQRIALATSVEGRAAIRTMIAARNNVR